MINPEFVMLFSDGLVIKALEFSPPMLMTLNQRLFQAHQASSNGPSVTTDRMHASIVEEL